GRDEAPAHVAQPARSVAAMKPYAIILAALALPSLAHADRKDKKRIYLRAGVAQLTPLSQSRPMELADVDGPASLALKNGPIDGSGATVSSATIFGAIVGYTLP